MTWQDLKDERTEDLITLIQQKDEEDRVAHAEAAFIAFTIRFRNEIIDRCRKVGKNWGYDIATADMIADKSFERFWKYPQGFQLKSCRELETHKCILLYFYTIVKNCFRDHHNYIITSAESPFDGTESVIVEFPGIDHLDLPPEKADNIKHIHKIIGQALATLSPKHKAIYLTYKAYEKEGYKLPRHLLKQLRDELSLSQNSIRVYKKEAFETVDYYTSQYGKKEY